MAEAENEAAFLSSMQAMNESAGGYSNTGDASGEQIDSSDEYDPAQQDVQDSSLPGPSNPDLSNQSSDVPQSNHPSRPASAQLPSDVHMQTDTVQSPSGASEAVPQTSPSGPNGAEDVTRPASTVTAQAAANAPAVPKARLPHDKIGILEDRIKEDEKGDTDAWLSLIEEHKARGKIDEARKTYERYLSIFPLDVSDDTFDAGSDVLTLSLG
jgi:cleavage stimulation factor subunit 3